MTLPGKQHPTTAQIAARTPLTAQRWLWLALPDDVAQILWLAETLHPGRPHAQQAEASYMLRELARTSWRREIVRPAKRPQLCRPSKAATATGYRTDSSRKREIRLRMEPQRRAEIARKGRMARNA